VTKPKTAGYRAFTVAILAVSLAACNNARDAEMAQQLAAARAAAERAEKAANLAEEAADKAANARNAQTFAEDEGQVIEDDAGPEEGEAGNEAAGLAVEDGQA